MFFNNDNILLIVGVKNNNIVSMYTQWTKVCIQKLFCDLYIILKLRSLKCFLLTLNFYFYSDKK